MKDNVFDRMTREEASSGSEANGHATSELPCVDGEGTVSGMPDGRTPAQVRRATQELLRHGFIEEAGNADNFRLAIVHQVAIAVVLEPLDLALQLDTHRGIAFLKVVPNADLSPDDTEGWSHPLIRKQRLTLEQSLLVAILRQSFVLHEQESGVGQNAARVSVDELLTHFLVYCTDSGSDIRNESRLLNLLDQLKTHGIVSEVDAKQEVTIRPLIAHLANPESLEALLTVLKEQAEGTDMLG